MRSLILFVGYLCCLCPGSYVTAESEPPDGMDDEIALLQHSLETVTNQKRITYQKRTANVEQKPAHGSVVDPTRSTSWIRAQLEDSLARRDRIDARIQALEDLLSEKEGSSGNTLAQSHLSFGTVLVCICLALPTVCYAVWKILKYERRRGQFEPMWYHHAELMTTLLSCGVFLWILAGVFCFTGFVVFNEDGQYLTPIESIYVSAQILTTVGYGDFVPASKSGSVFMLVYVLMGVTLVATLLGNWISVYLQKVEKEADGMLESQTMKKYGSLISVIVYMVFSTLLWSSWPGEEKTCFQALYMTIITLTTVGFGYHTPITQLGRLVGAIWMLVGWVLMAQFISEISSWVIEHRQGLISKAAAMKYFEKVTNNNRDKGRMDRVEFLSFEMIRIGGADESITKAMAVFDEIDTNQSGFVNHDEFTAYVKNLFG